MTTSTENISEQRMKERWNSLVDLIMDTFAGSGKYVEDPATNVMLDDAGTPLFDDSGLSVKPKKPIDKISLKNRWWNKIHEHYNEKHRAYHTLAHLDYMWNVMESVLFGDGKTANRSYATTLLPKLAGETPAGDSNGKDPPVVVDGKDPPVVVDRKGPPGVGGSFGGPPKLNSLNIHKRPCKFGTVFPKENHESIISIGLAIFFHDILYDTNKSNNEEASAYMFLTFNKELQCFAQLPNPTQIAEWINLSMTHNWGKLCDSDHNGRVFLAIDLSVLATPIFNEYLSYVRGVAFEYAGAGGDHVYYEGKDQQGKDLDSIGKKDSLGETFTYIPPLVFMTGRLAFLRVYSKKILFPPEYEGWNELSTKNMKWEMTHLQYKMNTYSLRQRLWASFQWKVKTKVGAVLYLHDYVIFFVCLSLWTYLVYYVLGRFGAWKPGMWQKVVRFYGWDFMFGFDGSYYPTTSTTTTTIYNSLDAHMDEL